MFVPAGHFALCYLDFANDVRAAEDTRSIVLI